MQQLEKALEQLKKEIAREEDYCIPDSKKSEKLKPILKDLYDESAAASDKTFGPLKTLIVAGIDEESIWEELQTRSKPLSKFIERKTRVLTQKVERKLQALEKKKAKQQQQSLEDQDSEDTDGDDSEAQDYHGGNNDDLYDDDYDEENEDNEEENDSPDSDAEESEDADDNEGEGSEQENEVEDDEERERPSKKKKGKSTADDMEEDLEMEAWLDAFEEMEYKHREKLEKRERRAKASTVESNDWDDGNSEDEEDDLDFVEKAMYGSDLEDDEDEEEDIDPRSIKYDDFFVDDSKTSKQKGGKKTASKSSRKGRDEDDDDEDDDEMDFDGHDDYEDSDGQGGDYGDDQEDEEEEDEEEEEEDDEEEQSDDSSNGGKAGGKSSFMTSYQRRKKELAEQIAELERELIAEKSWELKGEVKAATRPENSLLDLSVDIERSTKATPIITQEYTSTLEDLIMARIKDSRFNDPVPRNSGLDASLIDPSKEGETQDLSQEKSKVGLGELYAEEYAKKLQSQEETLDVQTQAAREEVINLYNAVARELDALSHFFYSPKPVASEASAKVLATQRALPALEMEDITPFSQNSSVNAAAPEELLEHKRGKKVTLLTAAELTREDRKKLRRHNKEVKKAEKAEQEKDTSIKNLRKQANKKLDEELRADKRVILSDNGKSKKHEDSSQFGKSSSFFSKLQEDTQKQIRITGKVGEKRRRDSVEDQRPAASFKL